MTTAAVLFALPLMGLASLDVALLGKYCGPDGPRRASVHAQQPGGGYPGITNNRENGLIWWAPLYALIPAGWWLRGRDLDAWVLPIAALIVQPLPINGGQVSRRPADHRAAGADILLCRRRSVVRSACAPLGGGPSRSTTADRSIRVATPTAAVAAG